MLSSESYNVNAKRRVGAVMWAKVAVDVERDVDVQDGSDGRS